MDWHASSVVLWPLKAAGNIYVVIFIRKSNKVGQEIIFLHSSTELNKRN